MSQRYTAPLACLGFAALLSGCGLFESTHTVSCVDKTYVGSEPDDDVVRLYQAFLERPIDDTYLSDELWLATDQHVVDIDRHAILEDNGFRVGEMVGSMPARVMELLSSKRACIDAKQRQTRCGESASLQLGPLQPRSTCRITLAGKVEDVSFEDAQYCLDVVPTLTREGRTQLEFTPRVLHRQKTLALDVTADYSEWKAAKPERDFPQLSWKVVLVPGQALIIGANLEKAGSLGYRSFVQSNLVNPLQRVLILRGS